MLVYKCDRCGRVYEHLGAVPENNLHISTSGMYGLTKEELDLCPMCATDFGKFMSTNPRESSFCDLIKANKERTI